MRLPPSLRCAGAGFVALLAGGVLAAAPVQATTPTPQQSRSTVPVTTVAEATVAEATAKPAGAARTAAPYSAPLLIDLDALAPSYLPEQGPIRVTGTVTNRSDETWSAVNLYPLIGEDGPLTTADELADAARTPPDADVGDRITDVQFTVDELGPGSSARFQLTLPGDEIDRVLAPVGGKSPGVYWFGVHALGESESTPRDDSADGRARTFVPYVPPRTRGQVPTALVIPLRNRVDYAADGSLTDLGDWQRMLGTNGRLKGLVDFAAASGGRSVSWMIDPAMLDGVRRLANGNPARSLTPSDNPVGDGGTGDGAGDSGTASEAEPGSTTAEVATVGSAWLDQLRSTLQGQEILALPYGNLDVSAVAADGSDLYDLAQRQSSTELDSWGYPTTPVAGAPGGFIDEAGMDLAADRTIVMSDQAFPDGAPGVGRRGSQKVVITSSAAAEGGPAPGSRQRGIQLRQRILAEAALRALTPGRRAPLVVVLPANLDAGDADEIWSGLDVDWLDLTTVNRATDRGGVSIDAGDLDYPEKESAKELDGQTLDTVDDLVDAGATVQHLLSRNDTVSAEVTHEALSAAGYFSRLSQARTRSRLEGSIDWLDGVLGKVTISAPPGVTLSGTSGGFVATISNGLDEPVQVGVTARASGALRVAPVDPIELAPRSRTSVKLDVNAPESQVNDITLELVDGEGRSLGSSDELQIRSAQVSNVIWILIGAGLVLLFGTIALRLLRGGRLRTRTEAVLEELEDDLGDDTGDDTEQRVGSGAEQDGPDGPDGETSQTSKTGE